MMKLLDACIVTASITLAVSVWTLAAFLHLRFGYD